MHMLKLFRTVCSFLQRVMVGFQVIRVFHYFKRQGKSLDVNLKKLPIVSQSYFTEWGQKYLKISALRQYTSETVPA